MLIIPALNGESKFRGFRSGTNYLNSLTPRFVNLVPAIFTELGKGPCLIAKPPLRTANSNFPKQENVRFAKLSHKTGHDITTASLYINLKSL